MNVYASNGSLVSGPTFYFIDTSNSQFQSINLSNMVPNSEGVWVRSGGITPPGSAAVAVSPSLITVQVNSVTTFVATVVNSDDTSVSWSVDGIAGGNTTIGNIDLNGNYTAPNSPGAHTITASLNANPTVLNSASVVVQSAPVNITVSVSPSSVNLSSGTQRQFLATVSGTNNTAVTWSVNGISGGSNTVGKAGPGGSATQGTITLTVQQPLITSNSIQIQATTLNTFSTIQCVKYLFEWFYLAY